ncbi:hypothetical protein MBLNU457_6141t1 [Dothideomycetes sp. NU457]
MANLLPQLEQHLDALQSDPTTPIDERLFESCGLVLGRQISQQDSIALITRLANQVPQLQQDPSPAINLLTVLLEPYSFSQISSLGTNVDYVNGLDVRALAYNRLLLALLRKASLSATDTATVAGQPEIAASLVRLWLCTPDAGIAEDAGNVMLQLLTVDQEQPVESAAASGTAHGQGLFWKRLFHDHDVYSTFFAACSFKSRDAAFDLTKSQRTLAQARLLEWLPKVGALEWTAVSKSHNSDIEKQHMNTTDPSLLTFAAKHMVDYKDDVLMHKCLIEFYSDLITTVKQKETTTPALSVSLDFLLKQGLHDRAGSFYLDPTNPKHDPLDLHFLYGSSANYVASYGSNYASHFLSSSTREQTVKRLCQSLDLSPGKWAHQESPKHDLHVLASIPRVALLPRGPGNRGWSSSPLSLLPSQGTNPDALNTLAAVFHGPRRNETITYPQQSPMKDHTDPAGESEAQAARALYYLYLNYNPRLFSDLVAHAETVALKDHALAAINVICAVITAKWAALPASAEGNTPSEADLQSWLPTPPTATPAHGVQAILAPPSLEYTLPYLIKPAQSFANLVGGRGDVESAAYKIASAKFDALRALHDNLEDIARSEPGQGYEDILNTLQKRITQGPMSREGEVGGQIATMEL